MLITNDPDMAEHAEKCGVSRLFVDLEILGKHERQGHLNTLISNHSLSDVSAVKNRLSKAELLVRINPPNPRTEQEIGEAINAGADLLMLPMFHRPTEIREVTEAIDGRVRFVPLVETQAAAETIDEIVNIPGVSEIYIGLNDLHLDMNLAFMFEPLTSGLLEKIITPIKAKRLPFGFGGIARVGEGIIPGELILAEHLRLGSSSVILSRTFNRPDEQYSKSIGNQNFQNELQKLIDTGRHLAKRNQQQIDFDQKKLKSLINTFCQQKKNETTL